LRAPSVQSMDRESRKPIAYGDSMSDVPLFETVGYSISVNGDPHLRDRCDIEVQGDDLHEANAAARRYIDQSR